MSGTNPDGSHYNDPGVRWISYFNGGDAIHAFPRAILRNPAEPRLRRATTKRDLEEPAVEGERLLDVTDLECDVVDADEARHGRIRWRSPNSCHR